MNFEFVNNTLSQLPVAMFGKVHVYTFNGTAMPFFTHSFIKCEMTPA